MNNLIKGLLAVLLIFSCGKQPAKKIEPSSSSSIAVQLEFAKGFSIHKYDTYTEIKVFAPYPDAPQEFRYILYPRTLTKPTIQGDAKFIAMPIQTVVASSTTDIPILEYLGLEEKLIGFPHTEYISSEKTRDLIASGKITELGNQGQLNTELTLSVAPDLIIGYLVDGNQKTYDLLEKTGIPVVINGSWMEQHPLGRAEWIKFIAAFFEKEKEAQVIFEDIKKNYEKASQLAKNINSSPTVLSGHMIKEVWHVPGGNSYMSQFFIDANTNYLWSDIKKTGSIALNFESVLEKGQNASLWIGAGMANSLDELAQNNSNYALFDAFKNKTVYSSLKAGATGGLLYYEIGPMRPDLILKDIIHIAHPYLLPEYEPHFFERLN